MSNSSSKSKNTHKFDIGMLLRNYLRHWWWFAISLAVCLGIGYLATRISKPIYEVRSSVLISQDDSSPLGSFGGIADLFASNGDVDDEIFIVTAHSILRDVGKDMGLEKTRYFKTGFLKNVIKYEEYPLDVVTPANFCDTLRSTIILKIKANDKGLADVTVKSDKRTIADVENAKLPATLKTELGDLIVVPTKYYAKGESVKATIVISSYNAVAEDLSQIVGSSLGSKQAHVIELSMRTPYPEYGQKILNDIVAKYNARGIEEKNSQSRKTAEFIDNRLAMITGDLSSAEQDIQDFKENSGITDVQAEAVYNTTKKSLAEQALIKAQTESEIIKLTRDFLADPEKAYELLPTGSEMSAKSLTSSSSDIDISADLSGTSGSIAAYNQLILHRMDLMTSPKANAAAIKQVDDKLAAMRTTINAGLAHAYENSRVAIRDLKSELARAESSLSNVPTQERVFRDLQRQQTVKQQLYLFLLQRREETAIMLANAVPKGVVIDEAYTMSKPVGLGKMGMMFIAFLLGLAIPPVLLYMRQRLRNKFDNKDDIYYVTDMPILGEMIKTDDTEAFVVGTNNTTAAAELFRLLRTNLMFVLNDKNDKVVIVTSTSSGEGKSFISINLAASLALLGKRVCLVGMDIRKPKLAKYLGVTARNGLTEYLSNDDLSLDSIITRDVQHGLDLIVAGPVPPNPGELLASRKVADFFEMMRNSYDYVIVDTAPIGMVSDTFHLSKYADATVFVCRANYTSMNDIRFLDNVYNDKRLPKVSLVVNGVSSKTTRAGYGYGYSYTK